MPIQINELVISIKTEDKKNTSTTPSTDSTSEQQVQMIDIVSKIIAGKNER